MSAKHFRIIALQSVFALFVFLLFVYFFVKYDSEQLQNQVNNMGQTLNFALEVDVNNSKGVLASFAYNYEIDPDLDVAKFETLAKHYIKVNPEIIYVQRKDKETTTVMVYPDTYNYTLGATLLGRPEVEEAVRKAIKDKIVTANAPYVLKDSEDLLGLVIRYPLYIEETFNGFIVVVMNIDNLLNNIIDAEMMTDYNISLIDDNEKLFWGYDGQHKGHVYINNIAILDNFWTIQVSMKDNIMASTIGFLTGTSFLFLLIVGFLVVMQIKLIKKEQNNQQLAISKNVLEKVKESYTLALDSVNDALWEWNITTNEIHTSDKWDEINGYEKGGKGIDAILQKESIHTEDYEQSVLALEACLSGEKHTFDIVYRTSNSSGNYNLIQNRGKSYLDEKGFTKILAGSISNITERKQTEIKLAESEELLSRSQELAHIGSWNLDLTTNKLYWSDETYRIFGCEPQEFTATYETFLEFIYPDDRAAVEEGYSRSLREKSDSYEIEHRILRQSTGEIRHVYERCVNVRDDAGDIIQSIGMIQDITERKVAETDQRMLFDQVQRDRRALVNILEDQQQAEKQLHDSGERIRLATEQSNVAIWEFDFIANTMSRSMNHDGLYGMARQERWDLTTFQNATHPDDREYSNQFIQNSVAPGGPNDYSFDFRVVLPDTTIRWLSVNGRVIERNENGQGIRVRGIISDVTQRKLAEESLKTYTKELEWQQNELENRLLQSVNAISKIGELRDVYTASHQKKVADLSCAIGREMGLADEKIRNLLFGGLLLDVGKFYIPSDILNKPGKVSDLEYKILQTHVEKSCNVVKEIDFPEEIYTMIYQHHERLDGSGYPQGISGDEIILESRILAVADVVEAMSSHRPYRSAWSIDVALEEIELHKGTRFDADVVDACIRLFREKNFQFYEK